VPFTDVHAKYFASELTKRVSSGSVEKLAAVLSDAQVDLNPHQIDAALFAFQNPLSKGAILADEVGLGKTIEAALLIAQRWAERRQRLLVITPANLRKQWSQELADKFHLPTAILDTRTFSEAIRGGNLNPFQQGAVILCSYQFARTKEPYLRQTKWDLVVIDEAHRLRNVYKTSSKIALAIKEAVAPFQKLLLTATPLQNSLLELYGLVSVVDEYAFGDLESYKARFARLSNDADFAELKERLKPLCKRTLRRQVLEYVKYTNRHALVQEFVPSQDEQRLYDLVSEYLRRPVLYALPASQRQLVTLILRKLLASSTYAIASTLNGLVAKLEAAARDAETVAGLPDDLPDNIEAVDELVDEWDGDEDGAPGKQQRQLSPDELAELRQEAVQLREFHRLAASIVKNSKGDALLTALRRGFAAAAKSRAESGAATLQQKAVIFTESRKTQQYLLDVLEQTEFRGQALLFNGTNTDPASKAIYAAWLAKNAGTDRVSGSPGADMRAALVEHFRDSASILIATEAAAEGINLQFCNLVVNYDLPWNPQRIEQRIGRCHRYGQACDVVVVNFLNKNNAADQRVYELLDEKFKLFSGVFGASDEVLGAVESGVDFEKRIAAIYQKCRTPQQIQFEFDELRNELDQQITAGVRDAREKLLDNFDAEVVERVRVDTRNHLDMFNERLWSVTRHMLAAHATFDGDERSFTLRKNPFPGEAIHPGPYRMGKRVDDANTYRVGHPLAQRILSQAATLDTPDTELTFDLSASRKKIAILESLRGTRGWLACAHLSIAMLEPEDHIVLAGLCDDGTTLDAAQCRRLFDLEGSVGSPTSPPREIATQLTADIERQAVALALGQDQRARGWFDAEVGKLDRWAEDRRASLRAEADSIESDAREAKRAARTAGTLPEKLAAERRARDLYSKHDAALRAFHDASRDIERRKDALLDETEARMVPHREVRALFTLRWVLV
jgi:ERCC4-related helicase